ncbi:MAG: molybdopterin-dependent oxidoreductase [Slackia sp.]|nr:molybdopterin-dependent oxidoreductase [Slackia sp.]
MTDKAINECGQHGFSRRSFIKGAAVLGAAGALTGCSASDDVLNAANETASKAGQEQIFSGACRSQCVQGCYLNVHVRDGQVVRTTAGDIAEEPRFNRICPKGLSHPARVYSAERLQYPMRRVGERGEGKFERITWDEAIKEITDKWKGYREEFGPESIVFFLGSGNTGLLGGGTADGSVMQHLQTVMGACSLLPDRDIAFQDRMAKMFGPGSAMSDPADWCNANHVVIWGTNPTVSCKQIIRFYLDAKEAGAQLTCIDIGYNTNVAKSDWFVPVNPATDGALALGVLREVIDNNWQDTEFVRAHTDAPFLVKDDNTFLRRSDLGVAPEEGPVNPQTGKPTVIDPELVWDEATQSALPHTEAEKPSLDGVPAEVEGFAVRSVYSMLIDRINEWTVEQASEISGVSIEDIKRLARMYGQEGPVTTCMNQGLNHYFNGIYSYECVFALMLLTGNIGKSGAGLGSGAGNFGISNAKGCVNQPSSTGEKPMGPGRNLNWTAIYDIVHTQTYLEKPFPVKALYCSCTNIVSNQTEQNETKKMLDEFDFVVVQEMTMNDTALYADILLPACHWFEAEDLRVRAYNMPYLVYNERAIEPLYESKPDFEVYKMLGEAMGYGEFFEFDEKDYINLWLDSPIAKKEGITYDTLRETKVARNHSIPVIALEGGKFPFPTGRARFWQEKIVPDYNIGQEIDESKEHLMLYWEPAREANLKAPIREKYPFTVLAEHMRTRNHTQWWDVDYMKEFERQPIARFNPEDAAELGIVEGDTVRLYNDRGSVTLLAVINAGQARKTINCPRSFLTREHIDGDFATISFNDYNQVSRNQCYFDQAVAVEKL